MLPFKVLKMLSLFFYRICSSLIFLSNTLFHGLRKFLAVIVLFKLEIGFCLIELLIMYLINLKIEQSLFIWLPILEPKSFWCSTHSLNLVVMRAPLILILISKWNFIFFLLPFGWKLGKCWVDRLRCYFSIIPSKKDDSFLSFSSVLINPST